MRIYIAGPMRGYPLYNFDAFDTARDLGRSRGHEIISPADLDRAEGFDGSLPEKDITPEMLRILIDRDIEAIRSVEALALLPGWERSTGAKAEVALAKWLGLKFLDATTFEPYIFESSKPAIVALDTKIEKQDTVVQNGNFVVKDSGERRVFSSGAQRDAASNKGFFHLIPYYPLERVAMLYQAGAIKYGKNNWRKGMPCSVFFDSCARHLMKLADGWEDEDHAAAILWNAMAYIWTENEALNGRLPKELLDMPHHEGGRKVA